MEIKLSILLLVAFCALLGAIGQVLFKISSSSISSNFVSWFNPKLLLGLLLYAIATILFIYALKQGNLSILYPIIATSYLWVALFSIWILGESMTVFKWIGTLLIILGIILIIK